MKIDKAISVLTKHNKWRKSAKIQQQKPEDVTDAIDAVIEWFENRIEFNPNFEKIINDIEDKLTNNQKGL